MRKIESKLRKQCGIYIIINLVNGKRYIGSSNDLYNRLHEHFHNLKNNKGHNKHLQYAWNKYTEKYFSWEILEICKEDIQFEREQFYISKLKPEYNFSLQVIANKGRVRTQLEKEKISNTLKAKYKNKEIFAYNQKHLWKETYVYDIVNFRLLGSYNNKSQACKSLGFNRDLKINRIISNLYIISYTKLITKTDIKNFIIRNFYGRKGYFITEKDNNLTYHKNIQECADFLGVSRSSLSKKTSATLDNPIIINNYKFFKSDKYLGSRLN